MAVENTNGMGKNADAYDRKDLRENVNAKRAVRSEVRSIVHHVSHIGINK